MRAQVDLKLQPGEYAALRSLTAEERDAVVDELLVRVREDLEWVIARAAVTEEPPALQAQIAPARAARRRSLPPPPSRR